MLLRSVLTGVILPPAINFLLLLLALILWRKSRRLAALTLAISLLSLLLLSLPVVRAVLFNGLEIHGPLSLDQLSNPMATEQAAPGAIVILAGGTQKAQPEYGDAMPSGASVRRLLYGLFLQRANHLPILLSGGNPQQAERSDADAMAELMGHIAAAPRWVESTSRNTWENAEFSAKYLRESGIQRVYLVTDAWHMRRAVYCFKEHGIEVIPAPTGFEQRLEGNMTDWIPNAKAFYLSTIALRENLGMLAYLLGQGRL